MMRIITVEVDKTDNGYQVVERTREGNRIVAECRYQEVKSLTVAERMARGGEFSLAKFRYKKNAK